MRRTQVFLGLLAIALAILAGCSTPDTDSRHPAVQAVEELLELRRDDVRDPAAYAPFFLESELATALAEGSAEPTGTPMVPEWEPLYLSAETTSTADVVVVWEASDDFPDWTPATVFQTQLSDDRWVVVDAVETTAAPEPLTSEAD